MEGIGSTFGFSDRRIQRVSQESQINIDKTLERLSTGLRLNRSADNPSDFFLAKKRRAVYSVRVRLRTIRALAVYFWLPQKVGFKAFLKA